MNYLSLFTGRGGNRAATGSQAQVLPNRAATVPDVMDTEAHWVTVSGEFLVAMCFYGKRK